MNAAAITAVVAVRNASKNRLCSTSANTANTKTKLCWLDLRGMGLSMLERLSLEEALLRHDDRNWAIIGTHDAWPHKYLTANDVPLPKYVLEHQQQSSSSSSMDCMIVMGIGGKPEKLLNIPAIQDDGVLVIKRFSGGGTVVLDTNSVWTTLIGRTSDFPTVEPYPRSIMEWSANDIFIPTFDRMIMTGKSSNTLVPDTKSCTATENVGKMIQRPTISSSSSSSSSVLQQQQQQQQPAFELRENDYVFFGTKKVGGNAQSIVKGGWLHHTSFLWDFDSTNMRRYLTLPEKRPEYRGDRSHDDFLVRLSDYYGRSHRPFVDGMRETCHENFELDVVPLSQVMEEVIDTETLGGMKKWFAENRTRVVDEF